MNSKLARIDSVKGVLLVGSASLGYADSGSDVDMEVLVTEEFYKKAGTAVEECESYKGVDISWEWMTFEELEETLKGWKNDVDLWVYSRARILYDPERELENLFAKYRRYLEKIWREKLFQYWYFATGNAPYYSGKALQRNDLMTAQLYLTQAMEYYTALIFILNEHFVPYRKWRLKEFDKLTYKPKNYKENFRKILTTTGWTGKEFEIKQSIIDNLVSELEKKLKAVGIIEEKLKNPWKFKAPAIPRI